MKQSVFLISICVCLLLAACKKSGKEALCPEIYVNLEHIEEPDFKELFSEIEIIPLETDSTLINRFWGSKWGIIVPNKFYAVIDRDYTVHLFDTKGKFIANSVNCVGKGPGQFQIMQDVIYNPYRNTFEVLDPFNNIYSYSTEFKFLQKKTIKATTKDRFRKFFPFDGTQYALFDDMTKGSFVVYDALKEDTVQTVRYLGFIERISSNTVPFRCVNNQFFLVPPEMNQLIFQYNNATGRLTPVLSVNGGSQEISKADLQGLEELREVSDFVLDETSKLSPVDRLISRNYLISIYIKKRLQYVNIYNRETGKNKTYIRKEGLPLNLPIFIDLHENVGYAIVFPSYLKDYIDSNLLTNKNILDSIQEEDNPCVIKYTLKL